LEKLGLALEKLSGLQSVKKRKTSEPIMPIRLREAISLDLILSKIAEAEGIKIEQKEIDSAIAMSQATTNKNEAPEDTGKPPETCRINPKNAAALSTF